VLGSIVFLGASSESMGYSWADYSLHFSSDIQLFNS
jgi:hypothetical protein